MPNQIASIIKQIEVQQILHIILHFQFNQQLSTAH